MPNYDFYCEKCGHQFEQFFSVNDDRKNLKCPECKSRKVQRNFGSISMGQVNKPGASCSTCNDSSCGTCSSGCGH